MTKASVCVLLAGLAMAGTAAASPTVVITQVAGTYSGDGGAFTLTPNGELAELLGSAATFESFCLEKEEFINPRGSTYTVAINDEALRGGHIYGEPRGNDGGDPLNDLTAYLYSEFRAGTLTGYNYNVGPDRATSAKALQDVIWYIEDEAGKTWRETSLQNTFYQAALNAIEDGWTNDGSVVVLNLTTTDRFGRTIDHNQDLLGLIATPSVPAPGAMVLGALGSSVVGFLRRRHML